jgi:hypothetical protein
MVTRSRSQLGFLEKTAFQKYQHELLLHTREHFPGHAHVTSPVIGG